MSAAPTPPPPPDPDDLPAFDRAEAFDLIEEIASTEGLPMEWMLAYRDMRKDRDQ
ncbi:hypothetical protein [Dinoroseobacter sp. S375]|uniref:hypothetical protein n=1 Tax=Dinoroseobacter sp. S375 TaxID=3415136 RepID=UPI003C7D7C1B